MTNCHIITVIAKFQSQDEIKKSNNIQYLEIKINI